MTRIVGFLLAIAVGVAGTARAAETASKPLPITIGWESDVDWLTIEAHELHLFKKAGLEPHYIKFVAGAAMLAAAESKSVDVSTPGFVPFIAGVGQGIPWVAIGIDGVVPHAEGIVARKGSGIKTLADLKGKKIGYYRASTAHYGLYVALKQNHISPDQVTLLSLAPSAQVAAMRAGQIDAAEVWEPWMHTMVARANGTIIADEGDLHIKTGSAVYAARTDWLPSHPETARRFMVGLLMAAEEIKKDPQPAIKAFAAETGIPVEWAADIYKEAPPPDPTRWLDPSYDQSMVKGGDLEHALKDLSTFLYEQKIIPKQVDVSNLLDTSVIAATLKAQHEGKPVSDTGASVAGESAAK